MELAEIAVVFSGIALIVSILSLWVNSFAPFSLRVTHDTPTLALYKITPDMSGSERTARLGVSQVSISGSPS